MLTVPEFRAKFHYHIGELVEIWTQSKTLHCFVLEHVDLSLGKAMHLDYL